MRVELAAIRLRASLVASKYVCICSGLSVRQAFYFLFRLLKFHVLRLHRNRSVQVNLERVIKAQYDVLAFE